MSESPEPESRQPESQQPESPPESPNAGTPEPECDETQLTHPSHQENSQFTSTNPTAQDETGFVFVENEDDPFKTAGVTPEHTDNTVTVGQSTQSALSNERPIPDQIGRYRVLRILGEGGFGVVYLARDDQLDRHVAIKVPRISSRNMEVASSTEFAMTWLHEAQAAAALHHPNIVAVYDVGNDDRHACYVVSHFIDGPPLSAILREKRPDYRRAAEIAVIVADALDYAHRHGLIHRDIKPGNILIDRLGVPHVVDFGLALREDDIAQRGLAVGTPAYMSPEQARGEGHRIDGRSDLFSLGVVLYEMLVGRRPFDGRTSREVMRRLMKGAVVPPRHVNRKVPKELERICLRAMASRADDRYATGAELAEDLRYWLQETEQPRSVASDGQPRGESDSRDHDASIASSDEARADVTGASSHSDRESSGSAPISGLGSSIHTPGSFRSSSAPMRLIPKGLRSFDRDDADFFLELLPGPRDRFGLPDSIRFWKRFAEETDGQRAQPVGLIYGQSGCGKSSLIQAGLIPRLDSHVRTIYIESLGEQTPAHAYRRLREALPACGERSELVDVIAAIRRGEYLPAGQKILLVFDQFEQYLHACHDTSKMVDALRQCDGIRVQAILLLRDDFWMAVTRFFQSLEIRLVEGSNSAVVDLFDKQHARRVLAAYGRAFERLPEDESLSEEHTAFLRRAVDELAREEKVVCVRLALFAQMLKDKPWTAESLRQVGGTEGVGAAFLDDAFSKRTAPPAHRYHEKGARAVLEALLPDTDTGIKGSHRSVGELIQIAKYQDRADEFRDLIEILDSELRLISPVDLHLTDSSATTSVNSDDSSSPHDTPSGIDRSQQYQFAHDYLVPSVRQWLVSKQKESRSGRAELLLRDRTVAWHARLSNRQLPTLSEHVEILRWTDRSVWSERNRGMMRRAARVHGQRLLLAALVLVLIVTLFGGVLYKNRRQRSAMVADNLVEQLLQVRDDEVRPLLRELAGHRDWTLPRIQEQWTNASDPQSQLRAAIGWAHLERNEAPPDVLQLLENRLLESEPETFALILAELDGDDPERREKFWNQVRTGADPQLGFRAAVALARWDSNNEQWTESVGWLVDRMVEQPPSQIQGWIKLLWPFSAQLIEPLTAAYRDADAYDRQVQDTISEVLVAYSSNQPERLVELIADADPSQFGRLLRALEFDTSRAVALMEEALEQAIQAYGSGDSNADLLAVGRSESETSGAGDAVPTLPPNLRQRVIDASGFIGDGFILCHKLPRFAFDDLSKALQEFGFQPFRVRPYQVGNELLLAVVYHKGQPRTEWILDATRDELLRSHEQHHDEGRLAIEIAGYVLSPPESEASEVESSNRYLALWREAKPDEPKTPADTRILAGIPFDEYVASVNELKRAGIQLPVRVQLFTDANGEMRVAMLLRRGSVRYEWWVDQVPRTLVELRGSEGLTIHDLDTHVVPKPMSAAERHEQEWQIANARTSKELDWDDPPMDPNWDEPTDALIATIESNGGVLAPRFAVCPRLDFESLSETLQLMSGCGYRPDRIRPFNGPDSIGVAVSWIRDGKAWEYDAAIRTADLATVDATRSKEGWLPVDAAGYVDGNGEYVISVAWRRIQATDPTHHRLTSVTFSRHQANIVEAKRGGVIPESIHYARDRAGVLRVTQLWYPPGPSWEQRSVLNRSQLMSYLRAKSPSDLTQYFRGQTDSGPLEQFVGAIFHLNPDLATETILLLPPDEHARRMRELVTRGWRPRTLVAKHHPKTGELRVSSVWHRKVSSSLLDRAMVATRTGRDQAALEDLNAVIRQRVGRATAYRYRAILNARLGRQEDALADLGKYVDLDVRDSEKAYLETVVRCYLGEQEQAIRKLENLIRDNARNGLFLFDAGRAFAQAAKMIEASDATRSVLFKQRAVSLLSESIQQGLSDAERILTDADLEPLHRDDGYQQLLLREQLRTRYSGIWYGDENQRSVAVKGQTLEDHQESIKQMDSAGGLPMSLSVDASEPESDTPQLSLRATSLWHFPIIKESSYARSGSRIANLAIGLMRLGHGEQLMSLVREESWQRRYDPPTHWIDDSPTPPQSDPTVTRLLIARASSLAIDPEALRLRYGQETDNEITSSILLMLGHYQRSQLSDADGFVRQLVEQARTNGDAYWFASFQWLMHQWGERETVSRLRTQLARKEPPMVGPGERYINSQGQVMIVVRASEFMMGSPVSERDHQYDEQQHRVWIGRVLAVADRETSRADFQRFMIRGNGSPPLDGGRLPDADLPQSDISWFDAAAYCNWLSEQDGIPEDQWCYQKNLSGKFKSGMRSKPEYWRLRGYRMPTEAEWEFLCRAGTVTTHHFGTSSSLLEKHAWVGKSMESQPRPVGSLMPNRFGLFDTYGNLWEWCSDGLETYPNRRLTFDQPLGVQVVESMPRALRGASFDYPAEVARSAYRIQADADIEVDRIGLRPIRTIEVLERPDRRERVD